MSRHCWTSSALLAVVVAGSSPAHGDYEPNKYTDPQTGEVLDYNVFVPDGYDENAPTPYPMMVCLHAANNTNPPNRTLSSDGKCWVGPVFANAGNQQLYPSFFLIPISQTNASGWGDAGPNRPITEEQAFEGRLTVVVVQELLSRYNIDPDRLYITGPSMGARGTWDIIRRHPDMFAAAAPAAGPASAADAALYINQNIWAINGENDSTAADNSEAIDAIRALGGNPIYTELANHGHDTWRTIYPMPEFMAWIYAQRRGVPWWSHPPTAPENYPDPLTQPAVVPPPNLDPVAFPDGSGVGGSGEPAAGAGGAAGAGVGGSAGAGVGGSAGAAQSDAGGAEFGGSAATDPAGNDGQLNGGQPGSDTEPENTAATAPGGMATSPPAIAEPLPMGGAAPIAESAPPSATPAASADDGSPAPAASVTDAPAILPAMSQDDITGCSLGRQHRSRPSLLVLGVLGLLLAMNGRRCRHGS